MNLQITLIILGALIMILVIVVSMRGAINPFAKKSPDADSLAEPPLDDRSEPSLVDLDVAQSELEIPVLDNRIYQAKKITQPKARPTRESRQSAARQPSPASAHTRPSATAINGFSQLSQIDFWAKVSGSRDISREAAMAVYKEHESALNKTHSIYGRRVPDSSWVDLETESEESRIADLVITIQLADTNGMVGEDELTAFLHLVEKLADRTGRRHTFLSSAANAMLQAQRLHSFRRHYDTLYVLNIKPEDNRHLTGKEIDRFARQLGMEPANNGYYRRHRRVGKRQEFSYSLADMSATGKFDFTSMANFTSGGLSFFTQPATNHSPGAVFAEMADTAKAFASRIKGEVIAPGVDDFNQEECDAIRKSIDAISAEMKAQGITCGSTEAVRLFA